MEEVTKESSIDQQPVSSPSVAPSQKKRNIIIIVGLAVLSLVLLIIIVKAVLFYMKLQSADEIDKKKINTAIEKYISESTPSPANQSDTSNYRTFTNPVYKYMFDYPSIYSIKMTNEKFVDIQQGNTLDLVLTAESEAGDGSESKLTFLEYIQKRTYCAADGPTGTMYCEEKHIKQIPFTTQGGIQGYEIYLQAVEEKYNIASIGQEASTKKYMVGPVFVLDVSKQTNKKIRMLTLQNIDIFSEIPEEKAIRMRELVKTIRFSDVSPSSPLKMSNHGTPWIWQSTGCGSNSPCNYKVCSTTDPSNCYSCKGIMTTENGGEKTPSTSDDPSNTTSFKCSKL